jgi:hypothetical protein
MKKIIMMIVIVLCVNTNIARADLTFEIASPVDVVKSVGGFVGDVGEKLFEGLTTTVLGVGEVITSPFRAKFNKPKVKRYYFDSPRLRIERGELYELKPRKTLAPQGLPVKPKTYWLPTPTRDYNVNYVVAN